MDLHERFAARVPSGAGARPLAYRYAPAYTGECEVIDGKIAGISARTVQAALGRRLAHLCERRKGVPGEWQLFRVE